MKYFLALLVLSIIIIVHELGHFILAKASGVKVVEFSLGMGPRLIKFTIKDTMYSLKLFLFGGSCQMLGEMDEDNQDVEGSYNKASVWQRIAICIAGPMANFILALVGAIIMIGIIGYDPCVVYNVSDNSPAYEAGLRPGDHIVDINGTNVVFYGDYSIYTMFYEGEEINLTVKRDNEKEVISFTPEYVKEDRYLMGIYMNTDTPVITQINKDYPAEESGIKVGDVIQSINGIETDTSDEVTEVVQSLEGKEMELVVLRDDKEVTIKMTPKKVHQEYYDYGYTLSAARVKCGPVDTIKYGFYEVGYWIKAVFMSFKMLFTGTASVNDLAGPVGIVSAIGDVVEQSKSDGIKYIMLNLLNWTIMISANLGVMNLLPLPALDGGKLVFLGIEAVRGKPIAREKEGMVHFIGIVLLLLLSVIVLFNDIRKLFM